MVVKFTVETSFADGEDFGRVSTMAFAGLQREPDMFPFRPFQGGQRGANGGKRRRGVVSRIAKDGGKVFRENAGSFA